jgi:two-component system, chemotaxis family, CheB/CheR fusion protein
MPRKPTKVRKAPTAPVSSRTGAMAFPIVGIGASAGGLDAFKQLLQGLPADSGLAFVMIQHLGTSHPSMLTKILARETQMPMVEADRTQRIEPNHVYIITPGMDLSLSNGQLVATKRAQAALHQPIDTFFESLAQAQGHQSIGVILSGSASDGTLGLAAIKAAGGITFAQDASATFDGMPSSAIASGCVDFVLPPEAIAREIARIARHPYVAPLAEDEDRVPPEFNFAPVLEVLRRHTGVDFTHYKRTTLYRRITRRMVLHKLASIAEYVQFLKDRSAEVDALYQDVLINVTGFFRDPETFDLLKSEVFPELLAARKGQEAVRFWIVGCATGEEAYSLAIAFFEYLETGSRHVPLQVFATDLNPTCIDKARAGFYGKSIAQHISPERLRRCFVEADGGYRIRKTIRDMCVFARHNVLTEPPFSRIDLIACRNVLIYLGRELQQRAVRTLHYALRPGGFLVLGGSETIGSERDLFDLEHVRQKIYRRKPYPTAQLPVPPPPASGHPGRREREGFRPLPAPAMTTDAQKEAERILLARYAPPGVLVNADFDILQFRGSTGRYLAPAPGRASLNALKMLREGLLLAVRAALQKAKRDGVAVRQENLQVKSDGGYREVTVEVHPVRGAPGTEVLFLVLFEDPRAAAKQEKDRRRKPAKQARRSPAEQGSERLKQELEAGREYLESVIEQQEVTNEELQAANEEAQSSNEELQSVNEELETSKEEIQATNEELNTVNEELRRHNVDLTQAHDDLVNLLGSVQMGIVMLDADLRIRRFTPPAQKMLNLIAADVGRPIKHLNLSIALPDFEGQLRAVIEKGVTSEFEVLDRGGHLHAVRLHPYRTQEDKIEGVVLVYVDIDAPRRKENLQKLQSEVLDEVGAPMLVWELNGNIVYWNNAAEKAYGYSRDDALGHNLHDLLASAKPSAQELARMLRADGRWRGEVVYTASDRRKITSDSRMVLVPRSDGRSLVIEAQQILQ